MRKVIVVLGLMLTGLSVQAQSRFFIKASAGPSVPFGRLEDTETQALAKLVTIGPNYAVTIGTDLLPNFGISVTGAMWSNPVKNESMTEYLSNTYLPEGYKPYVSSLTTVSDPFEFKTAYFSPYITFDIGYRIRVDIRANAGAVWMRFPGITGTGQAVSPIDNGTYDLTVIADPSSAEPSFAYGAGGSLMYRVTDTFGIFADVDGLRARPTFEEINVNAKLGPLGVNSSRPSFSQTAGTLSIRFGVGLYF